MSIIKNLWWFFKEEKKRYLIGILSLSLVAVLNLILLKSWDQLLMLLQLEN